MEEIDIAVIGGGPAGLRAAEVAASMGRKVTLFDGKPGVGRKFLVAGKGGLNITHSESFDRFVTRYSGGDDWDSLLHDFSPTALREWCLSLGQETFQATSGRVYPKTLKGAPILRAWLARLRELGVDIRPKQQWRKLLKDNVLFFENGTEVRANSIVFALGGASWPKTGSDGGWLNTFLEMGISCAPLSAANCGWECAWSESILARAEGMPIKNITVSVGSKTISGELLLTRYGLEGGTIYALGRELRAMAQPAITVDFKPTFSTEQLIAKLSGSKGNLFESAVRSWKLSPPAAAILSGKTYPDAEALAVEAKSCRIALECSRPVEEAISSAGGICWSEVDDKLMLRKIPGVFVSGEMLDWEAPTGGYLLQGAFATGTRSGTSAAHYASEKANN
jgi:uncharacterized flavoprotein (TIGR03862 family)|tara:strand:+ start:28597 stop:29778 length:1182 start_codon:yes stop_codon:yes gene_type:complete